MSRIVGIDLGTTNSLVAMVDSGLPLVIADADGSRLTPSVVHYPSDGGVPLVGAAARRVRSLHPSSTLSSIKRFMGRRAGEITAEERRVPYELSGDSNAWVGVRLGERMILPEEIAAEVLRSLKATAERSIGEAVNRAVITVPAYFNDAQRQATKRAGETAGFTVERIVNEPTAAALAYGLHRLKERSRIAVYDLGGGTFDLSILELTEGVFQVVATHGNTRLGGDDIDRLVAQDLCAEIRRAGGPDPDGDPVMSARVREAAEIAKIALSHDDEVEVALPFLSPGFSFRTRFKRERLEALAFPVVNSTRSHCLRALADAKLEPGALDQVILVGGQTRMPLVRRLVSEWFGCAEFDETRGDVRLGADYHRSKGPQLNTSQNPDEAVALGAAIQAEILSGGFRSMLLLDVTPLSLGLETFGGLMNVIIPRNSTIPVKAGEMFTNVMDQQRSMLIHVLQGERERVRDNWSLGRFTLEFTPAPKGSARVGVQFEIDANGILSVLARDIQTGRQTVVEMKSAVDVDDADVQRMVEESVEHAFEDLAARRWVESRLKATEVLKAAREGLAEAGDQIGTESRAALEAAVLQVEASLATAAEEGQTGDTPRLKAALEALDAASLPLADLLMDRAMEAALIRQGLIRSQ